MAPDSNSHANAGAEPDPDAQVYETEATGWRAGLYDDVKATFRAPIVNWVFRTGMANYPDLLRYAWGQLKPAFETRAFGRLSVAYRDDLLGGAEAAVDGLPDYRRATLGVAPAEFRELRGQAATFDVVAPRLAVLFELLDRGLRDESLGADPAAGRAGTQPCPAWLDRDRGRSPTLADAPPESLSETVERVREYHDLGDALPSVHRCLAQWPAFLERAWDDLEPAFRSEAFATAEQRADDRVAAFAESLPYRPRLGESALREAGFDAATVEGARDLFGRFARGPASGVVHTLPVYAATVGADGRRSGL